VAGVVLEEDFYKKEHRLIFKTIKNLQDVGKPVDLLTVQETLEGNGDLPKLRNLGGKRYLTQLAKDTPGAANIESYAEQIKERSNLRRLITTVDQIAQNARESDSSSSDQIIDHAEESILSLRDDAKRSSGPKGISGELLSQVYSNIQEANLSDNPLVGISTGFTDIDKITLGFQKSDLIIIAGRPSMGKTALALNIAENVVRKTEQTVLIFSMEMSAEQVVRRFIGSIAKIDLQNLMRGKLGDNDWEGIDNALSFLSSKNILLDDTPALSPTELRSRARRVKRENKDLAMIIVDYIGLMQVHGRSDNRVQEISEISRSLKALAKELDVPIVALSQLNRAVESRPNKRPILADLRDSGAIEQDADVIAFLYRHWQYDKSDSNIKEQAEINIAKQRNGPTGTKKLHFREEIAKFDNLDWKDIYPPQDYEDREEN
jgi:replicative DNA helicase